MIEVKYEKIGRIAICLLAALFLTSLASTAASASLSNSGGGTWKYQRDISIKENSGTALTDYQVLIELKGMDFPSEAKSNGDDIRFTDSDGNELNYWIEERDYIGGGAKIWVKVPSIPAGAVTTIRMYYGNQNAGSASNKNSVLPLYDFYPNFPGWSSSSTSSCGPYNMMGGYNLFGAAASTQKTITNLAPGGYLVTFDYYHIDSWDEEFGRFSWNDIQKWSRSHDNHGGRGGSNICGNGEPDSAGLSYGTASVIVNHPGGDAVLKFDSTLNEGAQNEAFGVNNIRVRTYTYPEPTITLESPTPEGSSTTTPPGQTCGKSASVSLHGEKTDVVRSGISV